LRNVRIMFAIAAAAAGVIVAGGSPALAAVPAHASADDRWSDMGDDGLPLAGPAVVVFRLEGSDANFHGSKLAIFRDPKGCYQLPFGAHVLDNLTTKDVTLYIDPGCVIPAPPPFDVLKPGYGAHVSPVGSFRVP
jgi:hypothetical protein